MAQRGIPFGRRPPGGQGGDGRQAPKRPRVLSVREAVELANRVLERGVPAIWVEGEVSNLVLARSGHAYFTLKDGAAALPSAMWASSVRRLRFRLEEGQRLRMFGRMGIYAAQGRFQFYAERAEPAGLGELTLALEQLKRRLAAEGLFAGERKRPLPPWPRAVGVVTSPTGAAVHDIIKVIRRRMPTPVLLAPAKVQGPEAPRELTLALRRLQRVPGIDVIIIGRGGGSIEDLWAFNHEGLTRAIAACPVPIVSAVGHEVDVTLCDLVADRRAATPSQAGELVVPDRQALLERLADRERRLLRNIERRTLDLGARLHSSSSRLERWGRSFARREREHLDGARRRLTQTMRAAVTTERRRHRQLGERLAAVHPRMRIATERRRLHELERRLVRAGKGLTASLRPQLARAAGKLDALSPLAVLGRGYALVRTDDGGLVRDAAQVEVGEALRLQLQRGQLAVVVTDTEEPG
ncbi:Exodeoxyribonuclease 7 large subunit [Enhygromyxa salina]|uniref:Exodeoxyribonuclease 7 large subunit n=1 Tax=Enhygromyxa salina TaxID=215803 RepID=A0A2S9YGZ8_9BACT|nr:exodeoxyribonuclease VII large subunit [Enhygromyxa salina]PRQ04312.1 Exodeoxyribonuclease 7 large subunit [Enhygromyxa salina]